MKASFIRVANESMEYETGMIVEIQLHKESPTFWGKIEAIKMEMCGAATPYILYKINSEWRFPENIKAIMERKTK